MSDLFDFFRENESKLHEKPSEQVWQKLQSQLERKRRTRQRNIQFLQISAVLATLLLILIAAWAVWHFSR